MRKLFSIILLAFSCKASNAQMIKKIDCVKVQEDSTSLIYSFKVKFDSFEDKDKRLSLVKVELEKKYQIILGSIIAIEIFMDKRPRTYWYRVHVARNQ